MLAAALTPQWQETADPVSEPSPDTTAVIKHEPSAFPTATKTAAVVDEDALQKACQRRRLDRCLVLAEHLLQRDPITEAGRAEALLERACDRKHGPSCIRLAEWWRDSNNPQHSLAKAHHVLVESCKDRHGPSCWSVAQSHMHGRDGITTPSQVKAKWFATQACRAGVGEGCWFMANYRLGDDHDSRRKQKEALPWLKKSCAARHAQGCLHLAAYYDAGTVVTRKVRYVKKYRTRACELGLQEACDQIVER